jgi:hypothetical protein
MTPWEITKFIEAKSRQRIIVAWDHARFNGLAKTKKFPRSIKELFPEPVKPQSPRQMLSRMQALHERFKNIGKTDG